MSGPPPPPPLGHPWHVDVSNNPNIARDLPPPPLNAIPSTAPPPPGIVPTQQQAHIQHGIPATQSVHFQHHVPILPPIMGVGVGINMPMPFGPFFNSVHSAGPLGVPRDPWNTPGLMGNPSSLHGSRVPGSLAMGFPPPPPGFVAGDGLPVVPPFAPGTPLWTGCTVPGVGAGLLKMGTSLGMGIGFGGLWSGMQRPAPGMITEASGNAQPAQADITQIAGGIPPGATHVEAGEHTLLHILKGPVYPWLNHGMPMEVEMLHMSSVTGINRLIEICMENGEAEGFGISECHEMVNGVWEKGQTFVYNDAMSKVLTLKDAGWDNKRNRPGGQSLHVYLHRV